MLQVPEPSKCSCWSMLKISCRESILLRVELCGFLSRYSRTHCLPLTSIWREATYIATSNHKSTRNLIPWTSIRGPLITFYCIPTSCFFYDFWENANGFSLNSDVKWCGKSDHKEIWSMSLHCSQLNAPCHSELSFYTQLTIVYYDCSV